MIWLLRMKCKLQVGWLKIGSGCMKVAQMNPESAIQQSFGPAGWMVDVSNSNDVNSAATFGTLNNGTTYYMVEFERTFGD